MNPIQDKQKSVLRETLHTAHGLGDTHVRRMIPSPVFVGLLYLIDNAIASRTIHGCREGPEANNAPSYTFVTSLEGI